MYCSIVSESVFTKTLFLDLSLNHSESLQWIQSLYEIVFTFLQFHIFSRPVWSFQKLNVINLKWFMNMYFSRTKCTELRATIFCYKSVISMTWEIFWSVLHISRTKMDGFENLSHNSHTHDPQQLRGCSWGDYAFQEADQELKLKIGTLSVWEIWVLEVLTTHSSDTGPPQLITT